MKQVRLPLNLVAFILVAGSFLITKANKMHISLKTPVFDAFLSNGSLVTNLPDGFTISVRSGRTVLLVTAGHRTHLAIFMTNVVGVSKVYYNP